MTRLNGILLSGLLGGLILIFGCTKIKKINKSLPFDIQISGPISNDTIIRQADIKEIFQRFNIKITNNNPRSLNFRAYDKKNDLLIPYTIMHTKKANNLSNKMAIQEIWSDEKCKIPPNSIVEKKMNINFYPDYDTIHFEFKFFIGEEPEMPVRISYLIQNGKLEKITDVKFRTC